MDIGITRGSARVLVIGFTALLSACAGHGHHRHEHYETHVYAEPAAFYETHVYAEPAAFYETTDVQVTLVFERDLGCHAVREHPHHYFYADHYVRRHHGAWQIARHLRGPWRDARAEHLPPGLRKRYATRPPHAQRQDRYASHRAQRTAKPEVGKERPARRERTLHPPPRPHRKAPPERASHRAPGRARLDHQPAAPPRVAHVEPPARRGPQQTGKRAQRARAENARAKPARARPPAAERIRHESAAHERRAQKPKPAAKAQPARHETPPHPDRKRRGKPSAKERGQEEKEAARRR